MEPEPEQPGCGASGVPPRGPPASTHPQASGCLQSLNSGLTSADSLGLVPCSPGWLI